MWQVSGAAPGRQGQGEVAGGRHGLSDGKVATVGEFRSSPTIGFLAYVQRL